MVTTDHYGARPGEHLLCAVLVDQVAGGQAGDRVGQRNADSNRPILMVLKPRSDAIVVLAMLSVFRSR
jgi:hypothetical protein